MLEKWGRLLPGHKPLPENLQTSISNPVQVEEGSARSKPSLELPTQFYNRRSDRRSLRLLGLRVFGLAALLFIALNFLPAANYLAVSYATVFLAVATTLFIACGFGRCPAWLRIPLAIILGYSLYFYLYFPPHPRQLLLAALAVLFVLADEIAGHLFQTRIAALSDESRIETLKKLWRNRLNPFAPQAKGLEFYWMLPWVAAASAYLAYEAIPWPQVGVTFSNGRGFLTAAVVPLVSILLIEAVSALFFQRAYLSPREMIRGVAAATASWCNYNRHKLRAPGVVQSPIASFHRRRAMLLAATAVLVSATVAHFHWGLELNRMVAFSESGGEVLPLTLRWLAPRGFDEWLEKERVRNELESSGIDSTQLLPKISSPQVPDTTTPSVVVVDGLEVNARQARILERLEGASREQYLDVIRSDKRENQQREYAQQEAEALEAADQKLVAQTEKWAYLPAAFAWTLFVRLSHFLVVLFFSALLSFSMVSLTLTLPLACLKQLKLPAQDLETRSTLSTKQWQSAVGRLRNPSTSLGKDEVFLGVNAADRSPIVVPRSVLREHMHLLGDSGSGKTSLGIAPLLSQLISAGDCSVVLLDMKGDDHSLIESARLEASDAGMPFRWFTNQLGAPTYAFNPLQQSFIEHLTLYQRADILTAGLGLQYGTDYGRSYFGDANSALLHAVFEFKPDVSSFREIVTVLGDEEFKEIVPRDVRRTATHITTIIKRLADWEPLNIAAGDEEYAPALHQHAIDLGDVFKTPQVVVFHIASALGTSTSSEIGRIALYSLLSGAKAAGTKRKQVFLVVDEFQRIVASNIELILQTARSMDIGVILANQTLMDLRSGGVDLIPAVRANTRVKQVFAASDLSEQQELTDTSGETIYHPKTWMSFMSFFGFAAGGRLSSLQEQISPRLRPNEILAMTDHPQRSVLHIRRGDGNAKFAGLPFVLESAYHISQQEYERRRNAAWPEHGDEVMVPELKLPTREPFQTPEESAESVDASVESVEEEPDVLPAVVDDDPKGADHEEADASEPVTEVDLLDVFFNEPPPPQNLRSPTPNQKRNDQ